MKVQGYVCSWNPDKYLGRIITREKPVRRYFFYGTAVIDGPEPFFNAEVEFEVSDKSVQPGHLPHATNITVLEPNLAGIEALKGDSNQDGGAQ